MEAMFVYMTAPSMDEARSLGRQLVEERLAACVNLLPGMVSIYRWEGDLEEAGEVVVIAKTRPDLFDALSGRVRQLHSYDCPCIVALPLERGNADYLAWIIRETG